MKNFFAQSSRRKEEKKKKKSICLKNSSRYTKISSHNEEEKSVAVAAAAAVRVLISTPQPAGEVVILTAVRNSPDARVCARGAVKFRMIFGERKK